MVDTDDFLAHYGVKGMKWGVRKGSDGVPRKVNRDAKKDAAETARAAAFYGKGAGTRRKLISQTVEGKSKRDPQYKQAFDKHLADQDKATHVSKAVSERKRKDFAEKNKQRAGAIARSKTGEMGTQAAFTVAATAGVAFLSSPQGRAALGKKAGMLKGKANQGVKLVKNQGDILKAKRGARQITKWLKDQ